MEKSSINTSFKLIPESSISISDVFSSVLPACCEHGCQVEPDGKCPHGNPSVLIYHGLI